MPAGTAGTLQAEFPAPRTGEVFIVSCNVPNAEATASWGAYLGGILIATWGGNTPFASLHQWFTDGPLYITGTGLTTGKQYTVNRIGYAVDPDSAALLGQLPAPPGGALVTTPPAPVGGGTSSGGGSGPPAPPAPPLAYDPEPFAWSAGPASGVIVDVGGYVQPVYFTLSNPEGQSGVWIMYFDSPAIVGQGVYLPSPGFLLETTWLGIVRGITAGGGAAAGGGMVMTIGAP